MIKRDQQEVDPPSLDLERYARQLLLKDWDQEKLFNATVFVAGVGALGTIISLNLVMMGVGNLLLCDFDTIELSNLARQVLFENKDIGKSKVLTAKVALERINPTVKISVFNQQLETIDRSIFENCDVIVDALDTFEARRWLNSLCITLKKPLVHGGMNGWMGNVQVVVPFETPCLECHPLIPQERLQKPCTPPGEERKKLQSDEKKKELEKIPTIATISTVIAGIESQEVIKLLQEIPPLDGFLFYDGLSESLTKVELIKNPNCIICGKYRSEGVEFAVDKEDSIRAIKNRLIMSWGLQEPMRVAIRGIIQPDDVKISDLSIKEREPIFVWDKLIPTPLKLYAILESMPTVSKPVVIPAIKDAISEKSTWSEMQELFVDNGKVTYQKNLLKIKAYEAKEDIRFFKTLPVSRTQRKIRYKLKKQL